MKIYRYCHPKLTIDISMPSILFWFFKRLATVKAFHTPATDGIFYDLIIFDEASE